MSPVLEDTKVSGQTEAVILQIIEDTNTIIPPQPTHRGRNFSDDISSREDKIFVFPQPQRRVSPSPSNMSRSTMSRSTESQSPNSRVHGTSQHKFAVFPPPARSSTSTPSRSKSTATSRKRAKTVNSTNSPGDSGTWSSLSPSESEPLELSSSPPQNTPPPPPMRSIFPRYDPELPPNQQKYYPNRGSPRSSSDQSPSRVDYGSLSPPSNSASGGSSNSSNDGAGIASVESLEMLWGATCGESSGFDTNAIHMRIRRIDSFTYNIGTGPVPFYTLKTDTLSDFELHKTHPTKPNTKSPIVTLNLNNTENRTNATVSIFPKMAEILAREQSLELARQNKLSPAHAMEVEDDAVSRIKAKETCLFEWQDAQTRYKLHYQAMMNSSPSTPGSSLRSAQSSLPSCLLNASVSSSLSPNGGRSYSPTILLSAPNNGSSSSRTADTPLVAVDLELMTLTIFANDILSTVPSLHSIDTLVAAILTVTVSNETTKQVLESIDIYAPKPEEFPDPYRPPTPNPATLIANHNTINSNDNSNNKASEPEEERRYYTPTGKQIFTTQAEREESEQEAQLMSQIAQRNGKGKKRSSKPSLSLAWTWPWKKEPDVEEIDLEANICRAPDAAPREQEEESTAAKQKKKKKKPALVVEEVDVERYGRYGDSSPRAGEKLPKPTRAALRTLFWFFSLIMWCLTTCVKGLAWLLVKTTQCVSSKKA
ncbi:hypothetical protein FQN49_000851 [Arthroderma sp. PD_2]|nr:hypothetical protein FQN49_000851 [Arthroderma sp. PD_2]